MFNIVAVVLTAFLFTAIPPPKGMPLSPTFELGGYRTSVDDPASTINRTKTPYLDVSQPNAPRVNIVFAAPHNEQLCAIALFDSFPDEFKGEEDKALRFMILGRTDKVEKGGEVTGSIPLPPPGWAPETAPWWGASTKRHYNIAVECIDDDGKDTQETSEFYTINAPTLPA